MIDLNKDFNQNSRELDRILGREVKSEKDIYNINLCLTYLNRQLLSEEDISNSPKLTGYISAFKDKVARNEDRFELNEHLTRDLEKYRYEDLLVLDHVKVDQDREKYFNIGLLAVFLSVIAGVAFFNIDIAAILLLIQMIYVIGIVYYSVSGKRVFFISWVRVLSMLGGKDRKPRDDDWYNAMLYLFKDDSDVYKTLTSLKEGTMKYYMVEMLREKFIETKEEKQYD